MQTDYYYAYGDFLKQYFPFKVQKITLDGGFTCPNRDGTIGRGGCTYCNNRTFHPGYTDKPGTITQQIEQGIRFFAHKYPEMRYLAYFQAYTGTYSALPALIGKYEEALKHPQIAGLVIGTRPDCMPDALLDYLTERAASGYFVLIEYGVESTSDATLRRINRGHTFRTAAETIIRTHRSGLLCGAHLMLGLPGECNDDFEQHAIRLSALPIDTIKLHQLQIIRHTAMAREYAAHPAHFDLYTPEQYADLVVSIAELLRPDIAIDRFVSQSPKELLIAPDWGLKNHAFTALVNRRFAARQTWQGALAARGSTPKNRQDAKKHGG